MIRSTLVTFTFAVAAALVAAPSAPSGTFLAIVRASVLQPIARFDGQSWHPPGNATTWPRRWPVVAGRPTSTPFIAAPRRPDDRCSSPSTMTTESNLPASREGNTFVVASAPVKIGTVRAVVRDAPVRSAAMTAVSPLFERAARSNGVSQSVLARVSPVIDAMYVSEVATTASYYVEASKPIPDAGNTPVEDPRGVVRVMITGWFRPDGQKLVPAATKAELQWEPADARPAPASLTPRAALSESTRDLWVMDATAGNQKSYALYAVSRNSVRMLVSVDAAGC